MSSQMTATGEGRCPICWREDGSHWSFPHIFKNGRMVQIDSAEAKHPPEDEESED